MNIKQGYSDNARELHLEICLSRVVARHLSSVNRRGPST